MGRFKVGGVVKLHDLSNTAYNGKLVTIIVPPQFFQDDNDRYTVELKEVVGPPLRQRILVKAKNLMLVCYYCHATGDEKLLCCGRCQVARYCSGDCQRNDWLKHKLNCKKLGDCRLTHKKRLLVAAHTGRLAEIQMLLEGGADINEADPREGMTALHVAADNGYLNIVQYLLQNGADKDLASTNGPTALYYASERGHLPVVQYLLELGADKNKADKHGMSPLYVAARGGHLTVVQHLVDEGAGINDTRSTHGYTPLMVAASSGQLSVV
jgi:Ankyrin repeats (3 copies)/MYND finger/Ankyrin repeat